MTRKVWRWRAHGTYAPQTRQLLEAVAVMPAKDDLYRKVQSKAAMILAASDDLKTMEKMAERFLDGEPLE